MRKGRRAVRTAVRKRRVKKIHHPARRPSSRQQVRAAKSGRGQDRRHSGDFTVSLTNAFA